MKYLKLFFSAVLFLLFSCNSSTNIKEQSDSFSHQKDFQFSYQILSEDGLFEISFPAEAQKFTEIIESELGNLETSFYYCEFSKTLSFILSFTDYPEEYINLHEAEELLFVAMNGVAENTGSEIILHQLLIINDYQAIDFETSSTIIRSYHRSILVNNRLYQLGVHSTTGNITQTVVIEYFNSFDFYVAEQ